MLSGYGMVCSYNKKGVQKYWRRRLASVWLPYVIWTMFLTFLCFIMNLSVVDDVSIIEIVTNVIGINPNSPIDATMWYVPYILIMYLIFYVVYRFVNKWKVISIFIASCVVGYMTSISFPSDVGVILYTTCFAVGVLYAEIVSNGKIELEKKHVIVLTFGITIIMVMMYILSWRKLVFYMGFTTVCPVVAIGLMNIFPGKYFIVNKIGEYSYELYLCEGILLHVYFEKGYSSFYGNIVIIILIFIVGVMLQLFMSTIKKRVLLVVDS